MFMMMDHHQKKLYAEHIQQYLLIHLTKVIIGIFLKYLKKNINIRINKKNNRKKVLTKDLTYADYNYKSEN